MITSLRAIEIGPGLVRVVAVSDLLTPEFTWYVDGALFLDGDPTGAIEVPTFRPVLVEVFDQDGGLLSGVEGAGIRLSWQRAEGAIRYRVETWNGTAWTEFDVIEESGVRLYARDIRWPDETEIRARVVAIDAAGVESVILTRAALVVRVPDVPSQAFVIDDGDLIVGGA
jgi:hypothetical protein